MPILMSVIFSINLKEAAGVGADRAELAVANHHAAAAVMHVSGEPAESAGKLADLFRRPSQQAQGEPQRAPGTDSGQRTDSFNGILKHL